MAASVENLFAGHADKLRLPYMHVVYTVPPWLKIRSPGVAGSYHGSEQIPCVKVCDRDGKPFRPGLDTLAGLIARRGDWERLVGDRSALDELIRASGGYLRDLFRLLGELLLLSSTKPLPADAGRLGLCQQQIRRSYLPIADWDARWLAAIESTHATKLPDRSDLATLAHFFDTHLVLTYSNGDDWFAVHPLLVAHVKAQAAADPRPDSTAERSQGG